MGSGKKQGACAKTFAAIVASSAKIASGILDVGARMRVFSKEKIDIQTCWTYLVPNSETNGKPMHLLIKRIIEVGSIY